MRLGKRNASAYIQICLYFNNPHLEGVLRQWGGFGDLRLIWCWGFQLNWWKISAFKNKLTVIQIIKTNSHGIRGVNLMCYIAGKPWKENSGNQNWERTSREVTCYFLSFSVNQTTIPSSETRKNWNSQASVCRGLSYGLHLILSHWKMLWSSEDLTEKRRLFSTHIIFTRQGGWKGKEKGEIWFPLEIF